MENDIWEITRLTLLISGQAVFLSGLIGIPLGAWLGLAQFRGKHLVETIVHSGMALPPVIVGLVVYLLVSRSGPLGFLGVLFSPTAMVLAQTILTVPYTVGITMTAVASLPAELPMQIRTLGASPKHVRWTLLREARAGVYLALAAALGRSLSEVGAVLMVGGNIAGHTRVLTTAIMLETGAGRFGMALALGGILLALTLFLNYTIVRLRGRSFA